ncbi:MAG TPA: winged helix-turn-helix domain-containing protein [Methanocorpusculum sp.]|nr:winged helix-turn-helix domain-containing protein [Methanocorpusculum sp.]
MDTEKEIRIIEQGSEDARLVSKAMASSTASELLDALSDRPKTATELEEETGYPLPTIQYHMGNLLAAGLVRVSRIRYSEKGKPMKLYAAADTILVISPKKKAEEEVRPVLRRYGFTAAGFVLAVSAAVTVCHTVLKGGSVPQVSGPVMAFDAVDEVVNTAGTEPVSAVMYSMVAPETAKMAVVDTAGDLLSLIDTGMLIFLIVALLILAGMLVFEILRIRKTAGR